MIKDTYRELSIALWEYLEENADDTEERDWAHEAIMDFIVKDADKLPKGIIE